MSMVADTVRWLIDASNWSGTDGVGHRMLEHVELSAAAVLIAAAVALPVALWLGHIGRGGALAINVSNAGRAIPVVAILVLLAVSPVGFGNRATVIALALFAVPPILTNAYVGMRGVDAEVKEAARGMGMTSGQLLRRVEVPLAVPLIAAGIRTATVQVVATATLAALVAGGGLGRFLVDGYGRQDYAMLYAGAVLVALLSVATEVVLGALQRRLTPARGRRRGVDPADLLRPERTPAGQAQAT
jgi:osmoprotectant transport system permease protein